ncbi:MAG TPA: HD family hydrolase [Caulobacteraceae bacterium]|nr:HD family hydrolase [Caulobacteraceae bacterium]
MLSGRRLDLIDPSPMDIEIEDIAHGLARVARWNGQTVGDHPFSVAQHCVLVESLLAAQGAGLEARWRLAALLHDAAEFVIGDMISPFKAALGLDYRAFEERLEHAINVRFGLPAHIPARVKSQIKIADRASAFLEATQLAGFSWQEAVSLFGPPPRSRTDALVPWPAPQAQLRYLDRFARLSLALGGPVAGAAHRKSGDVARP